MGNGASGAAEGGGVDISAAALVESVGSRYASLINRAARPDGVVPGSAVPNLRQTIAQEAVKKNQWWRGLDATKVKLAQVVASTPEEKMMLMFKWADKDWNGCVGPTSWALVLLSR